MTSFIWPINDGWNNLLDKCIDNIIRTVGYNHGCRTGFHDFTDPNILTPPPSLVGLNATPAEPSNANICIGYQSCATHVIIGVTHEKKPKFPKKKRTNFRTINLRHQKIAKHQQRYPIHQPRSSKTGFTVKKTQNLSGKSHSRRQS